MSAFACMCKCCVCAVAFVQIVLDLVCFSHLSHPYSHIYIHIYSHRYLAYPLVHVNAISMHVRVMCARKGEKRKEKQVCYI
mmetsp:Transcript_37728/g.97347  ORF Transcript_37728/g.97347 Transcript_37728/m.97347 type:complete len:81 (+) Transcript_37728:802-1044(+)